jgi:hypothetical protein
MNLADIGTIIKNPHACSSEQVETLKSLTEKYPYAQTFSILYLKALSKSNSIQFDEELKQHAFKITDRVKLYELIEEQEHISSNDEPQTKISSEEVQAIIESKESQSSTTKIIPEIIEADPVIDFVEEIIAPTTTIQEEIEIKEVEDAQIDLSFEAPVHDIIEDKKVELKNEISEKITPEDTETTIDTTIESKEIEEEEETSTLPITPISETELEVEMISHAISNNLKVEKLGDLSQKEASINEEVLKVTEETSVKTEIQNKENHIEDKKSFSSWLNASKKKDFSKSEINQNIQLKETDNPTKDKIDQLVDQFIKEEPSIQRPVKTELQEEKVKKDFFSPSKNAKRSLDEKTLPVSETLAKIFELQGNFPKAIYAYEQLILIIPEKKVFFANRIKELSKKLN